MPSFRFLVRDGGRTVTRRIPCSSPEPRDEQQAGAGDACENCGFTIGDHKRWGKLEAPFAAIWRNTMDNFMPFPSGHILGKKLHKAMEHLADVVLNPKRRWKNYAEHIIAVRDALAEVERASRAAKFAVEAGMKNFGLKTAGTKKRGRGR